MTIKMYDLALAHKGLAVETIPWRFTEKEAIAFSGQGKIPVMIDGDKTGCDSWAIAKLLFLSATPVWSVARPLRTRHGASCPSFRHS